LAIKLKKQNLRILSSKSNSFWRLCIANMSCFLP
jgi:hypothetical protein